MYFLFITKIKQILSFKEIITVFVRIIHTKHCGQNSEFLSGKACVYICDLNDYEGFLS
jgi:hypothetical protein